MSEFISRFKEVFCGKKDHVGSFDRLKMSDIKETLMEMGYEPEEGSKSSVLVFEFGKAVYEVRYEDYWLDIRMYLLYDGSNYFDEELCKKAAEKVNNEIGFVRSMVGHQEDGTFYVIFKYDILMSSLKEFKKFFPWYFKEIKDASWWYKKFYKQLQEEKSKNDVVVSEK